MLTIILNAYKPYLKWMIIFYLIITIFNILYNLITNKKFTIISIIPLFNIYQIGYLIINSIIGWIEVFALLLLITLASLFFKIPYLPQSYTNLLKIITIIYLLSIICIIIYGLIKLCLSKKKINQRIIDELPKPNTSNNKEI